MNIDQMNEARKLLRSQFSGLIEEFNAYGGKSWLVMTVDVYAHKPKRNAKGSPVSAITENEIEQQNRFVVRSDGFTQVEFEIIDEDHFKVLSNKCLEQHYPEDKAFNHDLFAVGSEVDVDTLRRYHRAYVQLSNARIKFGYELYFNSETLVIYLNDIPLEEHELASI